MGLEKKEWVGLLRIRNPMLYLFVLRARASIFISLLALGAPKAEQK